MHDPQFEAVALAVRRANAAEVAVRSAALRLRLTCRHDALWEADYEPSRSGLFYASPPLRMCQRCRIEEVGWGCGFLVLNAAEVTAAPSQMWIIGQRIDHAPCIRFDNNSDYEGRLIRKEATVQELIREQSKEA